MSTISGAGGAAYFGKLPSRADFVKANGHAQLLGMLDRWVSAAMTLMAEEPHWKLLYDRLPGWDFAFVGARSKLSVVGHLRPSEDASRRRFPFLAAALVERDDALPFRCGPLAFSRLWQRFREAVDAACTSADPQAALQALGSTACIGEIARAIDGDPLGAYVRGQTVARLQALLASPPRAVDVRRIVLAIGLLLRPLAASDRPLASKALSLPLPADPAQRDLTAALWVYLASAFLRRSACELQLLLGGPADDPRLIIGLSGASPRTLLCALLPQSAAGQEVIRLDAPEWIDSHPQVAGDYGMSKLSAYLAQPAASLELVLGIYREVFLGE